MFKSARWRTEKIKLTAVFRLRFRATQVSKLEGTALVLSIVPAENGKPTARLEKSTVVDGCCQWENTVSETVKLVQDLKSGKFQERLYYFLISTGSSKKSSLVGEAYVNIADYAEANEAASLSLPFKYSDSEGILHVLIQRIQDNAEQRDEEDEVASNKAIEKGLKRSLSHRGAEECSNSNSAEEMPLRKTMSQIAGLAGDRRASSGSDITLSSSDSSYGLDTPREDGRTNTSMHHTVAASNYQDLQRARWEWSLVPALNSSTDDSNYSPMDSFPSGRSQMTVDDPIEKLQSNYATLARKAELSDLELQSLRKQIVKETKRGQDLLREVAKLREERDAVKEECEKLKASQKWGDEMKVRSRLNFEGDPWALLEEIRQELNFEKDLSMNLRLQLQKTQESNSQLLLVVQELEQMLEQYNGGDCGPPVKPSPADATKELEERFPLCQSDEEEQKALDELVKQHTDAKEVYLLEQRIMDLSSELEIYRRDKDELELQMEQLSLDYEILKQEHHEMSYKLTRSQISEQLKLEHESSNSHPTEAKCESEVDKLENEHKNQSKELSDSLATIKELEYCIQSLEAELEKRTQVFDVDLQAIARGKADQELMVGKLEEKLKDRSKEYSDCLVTIKELGTRIQELEDEIEKQGQRFEADIQAMSRAKLEEVFKVGQLEKELKKHLKESSDNLGTIKQLETHIQDLEEELEKQAQGYEADRQAIIVHVKLDQERKLEKLERELMKQSKECSDYTCDIKELKSHIQNLEEELEKQAQGFEADLEAVTHAKVEQEQRAIRAEEALKLKQWQNINTAERLQQEFRKLSAQMQSTFEENEKVASKALTEASELRLRKNHLEEMLQNSTNELQSVKDEYEAKLHEVCGQLDMKQTELNQMLVESQEKSKQLELQNKHELEVCQRFSAELEILSEEIERLKAENLTLYRQAEQMLKFKVELEEKERMIKEREVLDERREMERENLEDAVTLVKAEKSLEELNAMTHLRDVAEMAGKILQVEVDDLRVQCNNLRQSLYEDELEKEKLRKMVVQLKADLKNKEDALMTIERKLKANNGRATTNDRAKTTPKTNKPEPAYRGDKEVATLKEKVKLLQGEIKQKETALESSAINFHKKEKDLYDKIKELESKLEGVSQNGTALCLNELKKENGCVDDAIIGCYPKGGSNEAEILRNTVSKSMENSTAIGDRHVETPSEARPAAATSGTKEQQIDNLLQEVAALKERNDSMETELKDMQERYSEISLRFAEVEGERQKLVMSLRNLKNSKKSS